MPKPRWFGAKPTAAPAIITNPDQAWKALSLVVDWIKHAETKAAATLASSGVTATILYNLVKEEKKFSCISLVCASACTLFTALAALCAGLALRPRLRSEEEPTSPLYYHHIARKYERRSGSDLYIEQLKALTADADLLVSEIASQIWANAHVARDKYRWGNYGLTSLLLALPTLAATAVAIHFT
ncbi:Pycsar system effector family protein [Streptomyces sp. NPDC001663]|uniref:Pycsar system effector family protein n=1 Tax=Streptomyces sp. NPDC001663 TaxID=3364597 RepID=UPI003673EF90